MTDPITARRDHRLRLARLVTTGEIEPCPHDQRDKDGECMDCGASATDGGSDA